MMLNLIAALSKGGNLPDGTPLKRESRVIYQCSEDDAADTIGKTLQESDKHRRIHMVRGLSFKTMLSNEKGVWVRVREISYLVDKGIIQVDQEALAEYADTPDPEFSELIKNDSAEGHMQDALGRELSETDKAFMEAGKRVADSIMITPRSSLATEFFSGASLLDDDFMADGRPGEIPTSRGALD